MSIQSVLRGIGLVAVGLFFLFPIFWIVVMSFMTNEAVLRNPPSLVFDPVITNYTSLFSGQLKTDVGALNVDYMRNLMNSFILAAGSVVLSLLLAVPAAYAFARFRFRGGEDMAFTILSFRFAPPLLVLVPLLIYFRQIGLNDSYVGLIWVYQLLTLPLVLWIVRGYFEDLSVDMEYAYRLDGHSWWRTFTQIALPLARPGIASAGLLAFIFAWNNFIFALVLGSARVQPVTVGALNFVTASGIQYGQIAAALVLSILPTLAVALYAQRFLVQGLSMGAMKG